MYTTDNAKTMKCSTHYNKTAVHMTSDKMTSRQEPQFMTASYQQVMAGSAKDWTM